MTSADRTIAMLLAAACLLGGGCGEGSSRAGNAPGTSTKNAKNSPGQTGSGSEVTPAATVDGQPAEPQPPAWPPGSLDISFDDIKFDMEKGAPFLRTMLTGRIEQLHGRDVEIRGYILPSFQQRGITQFVLVRDNLECCFGPGAALFDCILVEMESGHSTSFSVRPVKVDGTFSIREFKGPDGEHLAIYHLSGREVN